MANISLTVYKPGDRRHYVAQWTDPVTGRKKTRSMKTANRREAERKAGQVEKELREGTFSESEKLTWDDFRDRYYAEVLSGSAAGTRDKVDAVFSLVEQIINPGRLVALDSHQISRFVVELRSGGRSEATIKGYLAHLKAALRWAHRIGLLAKVPQIEMPKRVPTMKGRPITTEEYERMLAAVPKVLSGRLGRQRTKLILRLARAEAARAESVPSLRKKLRSHDAKMGAIIASWRHVLEGLWWSGLRRSELLELDWNDDRRLCVDFSGKRPVFRIRGEAHKSGKDCILPMAPEFAEFLQRTPEETRRGSVFQPLPLSGYGRAVKPAGMSRIVSRIGEAASVKVADNGRGKVKFASAHDLRRAFGFRWSALLMPAVLQQLMRHESITTTMQYYAGKNAEAAADVLWEAFEAGQKSLPANTLANTPGNRAESDRPGVDVSR